VDTEQLAAVRRLTASEDAALSAVRARAEQTTTPPSPEVGAMLRLLAGMGSVRHAVEIGAAGGVSATWLIAGMGARGVLTSIEADTHLHGLATAGVAETGVGDRVRSILGDPATVVDRLSDDGYDLVLLQGDPAAHARLLPDVERLLRPGGLLVARRVLGGSTDSTALVESVAVDPWSGATVLPVDDGLLLARLAPDAAA
jgi:predicted O-methyltransferase YrrM